MELKWAWKAGSVVRRFASLQLVLLAITGLSFGRGTAARARALPAAAAGHSQAAQRSEILRNYNRLPLSFEPNLGQSDPQVKFLAHGQGYGLFLTSTRALLSVSEPAAQSAAQTHLLSLELLGANPAARVSPEDKIQGVSNYLLGDNPQRWHTNIPHYSRVGYAGIYPGVNLVYYGRQQQLEYDFMLAPGADPSHIQLQVEGAQALRLNRDGALELVLPGGAIQMRPPVAYQLAGAKKQLVAARYLLKEGNRIALRLGNYDRRRALVIDPQVSYSSYLGGTGSETSPAIAVDSGFSAYLAGTTNSPTGSFPTTSGAFQTILKGTTNVFVTKFNSSGTGLIFSTYLGGTGADSAAGIAVDSGLNVFVAGTTTSSDFPITPGKAVPDSPAAAGTNHAFVTELNSSGTALAYSTYLAGNGVDVTRGVAVGPQAGTVFATGTTTSGNFATVSKPAGRGTSQFFVTKLNTANQGPNSLVYSTYVGGATPSTGATDGGGIAVDSAGDALITGGTTYSDMPVFNAIPSFPNGGSGAGLNGTENAFVAKLDPNGLFTSKSFLTYLGGNGTDIGNGIATDAGGNAYVTGSTSSSTFPVLAAAGSSIFQSTLGASGSNAFVTKVAAAGNSLIWSTYLGASATASGAAIAVDANQNTFVTGSATTGLNVTSNATQSSFAGGATDAFVGKFDISANPATAFVTYLGAGGDDRGTGIAVDINGNPYVAGDTTSATGLSTTGAFQAALNGSASDAFVTHYIGISALSMTSTPATVSPNPMGIGNAAVFTFTILNTGPDPATAVVFTNFLPGNGIFQSATPSQGVCSLPVGSTFACSLGELAVGATATVAVHITANVAGALTDSATASSSSPTGSSSTSVSTLVNDFTVDVENPTSATVTDGQAATYTVRVSPVPANAGFPNGVSLRCTNASVPTAAMCAFSTPTVIPNGTPVTSSLTISTTAPVPGTTASLFSRELRGVYAVLLPLGGIAFLGFGLGGDGRRRKRLAGFFVLLLVLGITALQPACSSSSNKTTPPPFTPKGTYNIAVQAVSGPVVRSTTVKLTVQ